LQYYSDGLVPAQDQFAMMMKSSLSFPRLLLSLASFSFALYLFTGLFGAELKGLSTVLPPPPVTEFPSGKGLMQEPVAGNHAANLCSSPKYSSFLTLPHGLHGYFDYDEALVCARDRNKPVLVDFVGHTCSNCKKMYSEVWSDPRVLQLLRDDFVVVALYTDDRTKLPK
jgi:thiol:disulfide interchange protein DsbD